MNTDVGMATELLLQAFLYSGRDCMSGFQSHHAIHTQMHFDCNVIAYATCAEMVWRANLREGSDYVENPLFCFCRQGTFKKFVDTRLYELNGDLDDEDTDDDCRNRIKDSSLLSKKDGTSHSHKGSN